MADSDKLFQDAINLIGGVRGPDIEAMKVKLQKLVQQGLMTPEQAQTALVQGNAFDDVNTDPVALDAQQRALARLQEISDAGGLTATDKSRIQDITDEQNNVSRGREEAILSNARERGVGGSGLEFVLRQEADQNAANEASKRGLDVAALAEQRALDALMKSGDMGTAIRGQDFNEQATKASSQNAIDLANAQMLNQGRQFNVTNNNAAQAQNLSEKQRVADANAGIENTERTRNADLEKTRFDADLAKATGQAGVMAQWGGEEAKQAAAKTAYQQKLTAGLVGAGVGAVNPAAGAFTFAAAQPSGPTAGGSTDPYQRYRSPSDLPGAAHGDYIPCAADGELVPGEEVVPGDDPANDTVLRRVSPGEAIVPKSVTENPDVAPDFIRSLKGEGSAEINPQDVVLILKALVGA